jgi:phospholipid/cholesterol/gamma-HCH transport system substrate-binding protein
MRVSKKFWVGVFIVGGILLFCVGLFIIGSSQQMFQGHFHAYSDYKAIDTLTKGARVRVSGMDAGQVTDIDIPQSPNGQFRLHLEIDAKFHHLVRENSVTSIETSGMVGSKYVDVKMGTEDSPECNQCTLRSQAAAGMDALMKEGAGLVKQVQSTISDVQHHADSAIDNFSSIASNVNQTIDHEKRNLHTITTNAAQLTGNANAISLDLRQGRGTAGKLLTDETMASNVEGTIANAKQTSANAEKASENVQTMIANVQRKDMPDVHTTIQNAKDMSNKLDQAVGTFLSKGNKDENTAEAMRDTVQNASQAAGNLADDTEAIKHNFFLRGFFKRRGYFNLSDITRNQYPGSPFVKSPTVRVWVPETGLFTIAPDGTQQLTAEGKNLIDQNMSSLVPYLPRNPIMVEGYAETGTPDQRYIASRDRAVAVRDYVESRFHVNSKIVGIMPMGNHPPEHTGKQEWNGVALVLVKSK